ncbi:large subunit ribosomal protein L15 [Geosmithia morbida]|uniref:Large subunit ribosomal protein L15 n=1 Tax=Geosmithia morbida TaxID=1094350 RepID=A0A9P4YS52_9HYPO|nr:large subunit ribosomal protein L15 [Geosmithia morbida]KAF4120641.1 large subunit ribosomal protein L15 [Geosmithia morbida]
MQPCRTALARSRQSLRLAGLRAYYSADAVTASTTTTTTTPPTPESFKISESSRSAAAPRWSQTPPAMRAPIQMDVAKKPENKVWVVNSDPKTLDEMYNRLLGPGGSKMLPEELKWLAVTHKSFDQGRRGFNDRLALMGRMTLVMETTKHIVSKEPLQGAKVEDEFSDRREPFVHEQLTQVDNLSVETTKDVAGKDKLYALATEVGMLRVLRWKPRLPNKLDSSGVETVMNGAILAIIGAINLQHGSAVASQVVRERILGRL